MAQKIDQHGGSSPFNTVGMPQNICTTHPARTASRQASRPAASRAARSPCVHGHHAAAHLGGHHDIISGELLRKLFQILSLCGQGLHLRNAGAGQALRKGVLAAVQRPGDKRS